MDYDYKHISIYFDRNKNLIGVPTSMYKKWQSPILSYPIIELNCDYNDDVMEKFIKRVFNACYSHEVTDKEAHSKQTSLSDFLKVKSYKASVKNLGLISVDWVANRGYLITPTWQNINMKCAFDFIQEKKIMVPTEYKPGELAIAIRKAMELSPVGPQKCKPE